MTTAITAAGAVRLVLCDLEVNKHDPELRKLFAASRGGVEQALQRLESYVSKAEGHD